MPCNPHPDAPHGFDRNSSHGEDRYVCDCEHWNPPGDSLRDRIAAAISAVDDWRGVTDPAILADAVIAALGRYEYAVATDDLQFICMYVDEKSELDGVELHPGEQIVRRYVTGWVSYPGATLASEAQD